MLPETERWESVKHSNPAKWLDCVLVEHHLKLSNRFIEDFKRVVAFIHWCRYKHLLVP